MKKYAIFFLFGALVIFFLPARKPANPSTRSVAAMRSAPPLAELPTVEPASQASPEDVEPQLEDPVQIDSEPESTPDPHTEDPLGEKGVRTLAQARTELWQILLRTDSIHSISLEGSASDRAIEEAVSVEGHTPDRQPRSTADPIH